MLYLRKIFIQQLGLKFYKRIYYLIIILTIVLCSCNGKGKRIDGKIPAIIPLEGVTLKNNSEIFLSSFITLHDSTFYVTSMREDTLIKAYQIKGDSLIYYRSFLTRGNGPYEMTVFGTLFDKEAGKLSLFENSGKLTFGYVIDMDSVGNIYNTIKWKKIDFKKIEKNRFGNSFVYMSDSLLLAIGGVYYTQNILTIINLKTQSTTSLQFWPDDGFESSTLAKQSVYIDNAKIFKNKKLNKYLYVCGDGRYMEVFSIIDNQVVDRSIICDIFPKYRVSDDKINYTIAPEFKYKGLRAFTTDNYIYVLPMEYVSSINYKGYPNYYNDRIEVFDWDGNLIKEYLLDTPCCTFIVDSNDEILYVDTDNLNTDETIIKKYYLK